jgi:hydrogenase maturation protein HypF
MSAVISPDLRVRHRIRVVGVVQGVGFRPFVYRLAAELELAGHVGNDNEGVLVEVEGRGISVGRFEERLAAEAPPLAMVYAVEVSPMEVAGERGFRIADSNADGAARTFVSPDIAVCDDCLGELLDPRDRRFRYPFINCTNCGPRFSITVRLPYDRPNTTMSGFALCPDCAREYQDPGDRRFHAEPIACPACGPRLWFESRDGTQLGDAAVAAAQQALGRGQIVAVKGLGGYHLACDAGSDDAVRELRGRKHRLDKPFAVMVRDLAGASRVGQFDTSEAALLRSPQRPIVLVRRVRGDVVTPVVAPGNPHLGLLLPYTPLHHLLFRPIPGSSMPVPEALVMTSGNVTDEPICYDDADARQRLGRIADAWLIHDRPIHVPCDDSVVRIEAGQQLPIRRSRGYAPLPVRLPFDVAPGLAVGGDVKNTFCLASGRDAWISQHLGDMGSLETVAAFQRSTEQFCHMYRVELGYVTADAHPGYHTRRWAEDHPVRSVELVQHHHAHVAAIMVEQALPPDKRVIGIAFDGTGYGTDGAIWGGEILVTGYDGFERAAHLKYVSVPGGDATVRKPYRSALSHLWAAGIEWAGDLCPVRATPVSELAAIERQLQRGVHCVPTSSMGRLFDAVSSLLDVRHTVTYEAQAAIELEALADGIGDEAYYRFGAAADELDPGPVLRAMVEDLRNGADRRFVARGFHTAVARLVADTADRVRGSTGLEIVALSGGVFQNVRLVALTRAELIGRGFRVVTHRVVPPNDGGMALGQAAVAGYARSVATGSGDRGRPHA